MIYQELITGDNNNILLLNKKELEIIKNALQTFDSVMKKFIELSTSQDNLESKQNIEMLHQIEQICYTLGIEGYDKS